MQTTSLSCASSKKSSIYRIVPFTTVLLALLSGAGCANKVAETSPQSGTKPTVASASSSKLTPDQVAEAIKRVNDAPLTAKQKDDAIKGIQKQAATAP